MKWEYKMISVTDDISVGWNESATVTTKKLIDVLNRAGKDGWEAVNLIPGAVLLKRPIK